MTQKVDEVIDKVCKRRGARHKVVDAVASDGGNVS